MTSEARKRYIREYRKKNRDKIKQWQLNAMRAKALADMESVKSQTVDMHVIHTLQGSEYHISAEQ